MGGAAAHLVSGVIRFGTFFSTVIGVLTQLIISAVVLVASKSSCLEEIKVAFRK